eukprot:scaffold4339_cov100-Skeletonema_dohrnii-CCMP3373.AAC.6
MDKIMNHPWLPNAQVKVPGILQAMEKSSRSIRDSTLNQRGRIYSAEGKGQKGLGQREENQTINFNKVLFKR